MMAQVHISDFGVVGSGDETSKIQAAIDAAVATKSDLHFDGTQTYTITDTLTVAGDDICIFGHGARLDGSGITVGTALDQRFGLKVEGSIGPEVQLIASHADGAKTIMVSSTAGFAADELILIQSEETHPVGGPSGNRKGELHRIRSIDSSTSLTIYDGLFLAYNHTSGGAIQKVSTRKHVQIIGLQVQMGGAGRVHNGIGIKYAEDCWLRDCTVSDSEDCNVRLTYCLGGGVNGGTFRNATSPGSGNSGVGGNTGYGVLVGDACQNVTVEGATFRNNRHAIAGGGTYPPILTRIANNHVAGSRTSPSTNYDIECHEDCLWWTFEGNVITGSLDGGGSGGLMVRGQGCRVSNNIIVNSRQYGIYVHSFDANANGLKGASILGNIVSRSRLSGIYLDGDPSTPLSGIIVSANRVTGAGDCALQAANVNGLTVAGNEFAGGGQGVVRLLGSPAPGDHCSNVVISGNRIDGCGMGVRGIYAQYTDVLVEAANLVTNVTGAKIDIGTATNVQG